MAYHSTVLCRHECVLGAAQIRSVRWPNRPLNEALVRAVLTRVWAPWARRADAYPWGRVTAFQGWAHALIGAPWDLGPWARVRWIRRPGFGLIRCTCNCRLTSCSLLWTTWTMHRCAQIGNICPPNTNGGAILLQGLRTHNPWPGLCH